MKKILFAAAIALLPIGATAAEAPVKQDPTAAAAPAGGPTILDCLTILSGLNEIDGKHQAISNQGKPNEQVVDLPYEFNNGRLRGDIAHNIALLSAIQRTTDDARIKIFTDVGKGADKIEPGTPASTEYDRQMRQLTSAPCSIDGLVRIKISELKLDKNEIRAGALASIDKILDRDK